MRYLIIKNKKLYKLFYKLELKRLQYKSLFYNRLLPSYIRSKAFYFLKSIDNKSSYTRIKQRCFVTNNSRSVINHFKISRIKLRTLVSNNYLNGVKKLSW
jgi:ribosomal protein S14